jgi:hypothetical protein
VPSGWPSASATSPCVSPPRKASSIAWRCGAGRAPSEARTACASSACSTPTSGAAPVPPTGQGEPLGVVGGGALHDVGAAPPRPQHVEGARAGGHRDPRPDAAARRVEARRVPPELREGRRDGVLGVARLAHDGQAQGVHGVAMTVVEGAERPLVAVGDARDERDVGRRLGGHGGGVGEVGRARHASGETAGRAPAGRRRAGKLATRVGASNGYGPQRAGSSTRSITWITPFDWRTS